MMRVKSPMAVLGSVIALVAIVAAVIGAVVWSHGVDDKTTPLITTLLGIVATAVPSILALVKVESVQEDIRNGVVKQRVVDALQETGVTEVTDKLNNAEPVILGGPTLLDSLADMMEQRQNRTTKEGESDG